ncbi:MAG: FG-GAP-like repeat-containing protein [Acidobacteriota bacterium]
MTLEVVACVLLFTVPFAGASEVPFSGKNVIDADLSASNSVVAADIDGDGDLDIVGAAITADDITWWENTAGDGSAWTEHTIDANFDGAYAVRAADIDGDGDLDVVAAASRADSVSWWENTAGDGSAWTERNIEPNFDFAASVHVADVDGDGDLDVLGAAVFDDELAWWENTSGDGSTWTKQSIEFGFSGAASVFAADLDGDGDLDILGTEDSGISWWANTQGDGSTWGTRQAINTVLNLSGAVSAFAADVDSDGDLDVFAAAQFSNEFAWWENTAGDGSAWTGHLLGLDFEGAISVVVEDMDGDGDLDVVGGSLFDSEAITWWDNTAGDASVWARRTIDGDDGGASSVFVADVDSDGDLDVLGTGGFISGVNWWENETIHRSATFPESRIVDRGFDRPLSIHSADVDGDGDLDVLGASFDDGELAWWANAGDGSAWTEQTIDASFGGALFVTTADLDGDGDLDVLGSANSGSSPVDNDISWWENTTGDGSAWSVNPVANAFNAALSVHAADIDGDGDLDIVGASRDGDDVSWWENTAGDASAFTERPIDTNFDGASSVAIVDLDRDGDLDVVGAAQNADEIAWWENTAGDGTTWTQYSIAGAFDGAIFVVIADVDGDGDPDVLGAARDANDISWFENTAGDASAWAERSIDDDFDRPFSVYASDLDADGDLDVVAAAANADEISWWENTADDGTAWAAQTIDGDFDGARSVVAADLDGDGDADVVAASRDNDEIAWWENRGGQFALSTLDAVSASDQEEGTADVALLKVQAAHRGRTADADVELVTLELLFEQTVGDPLTDAELDALLATLRVYHDDGDGSFDPSVDFNFYTAVPPFMLAAGVLTATFVDGEAAVQVAPGVDETYFVAVDLQPTAAAEPANTLRVTHLAASSTAEMATTDIQLRPEFSSETSSTEITVTEAPEPEITVDPLALTFGTQVLGAGPSATRSVTIANDGPGLLQIAGVALTGTDAAEFSVVSDTGETTLDPASTRTIVLEFEPQAIGVLEASLEVMSNDTDEAVVDVQLSGEGIAAESVIFRDGFESGGTGEWSSAVGGGN